MFHGHSQKVQRKTHDRKNTKLTILALYIELEGGLQLACITAKGATYKANQIFSFGKAKFVYVQGTKVPRAINADGMLAPRYAFGEEGW